MTFGYSLSSRKTLRLSLWDNWGCDEGHWHAHTRGLPWGLPEVVGTVQQVHCSRRRLLRRRLGFHECPINKRSRTKKSLETYWRHLVICFFTFHFITKWTKYWSERQSRRRLRYTHGGRYESLVNRFFFVLLSRDWYRANWKHLIISAFICFSTSFSFRDHTRFRLSQVCFFTRLNFVRLTFNLSFLILTSLVQLRPFSTSKRGAVWHKARALSGVTSSDSSGDSFLLIRSKKKKNLLSLNNFSDAHAILMVRLPSGVPPTQFTRYFRHVLPILRHRCTSCFDTLVTFVACQWLLLVGIQHYAKTLRAVFKQTWEEAPYKIAFSGHLLPISQTIEVRRARHTGHCWRSRGGLVMAHRYYIYTYIYIFIKDRFDQR